MRTQLTSVNDRKGLMRRRGERFHTEGAIPRAKRFHWRDGSVRATKRFHRMGAEQLAPKGLHTIGTEQSERQKVSKVSRAEHSERQKVSHIMG